MTHQKAGGVVQQTAEAHGEGPLQQLAVLRPECLGEGGGLAVRGQEGVPHQLPLQLLAVLAVHQLVHGLVDYVRLETETKYILIKLIIKHPTFTT